jgi:hypothetical protein
MGARIGGENQAFQPRARRHNVHRVHRSGRGEMRVADLFYSNFVTIAVLLLACVIVLLALFVLAVQLFRSVSRA